MRGLNSWSARALVAGALTVVATASVRAQGQTSADGERWWHDITVLANDSLQGRMTGTASYRSAAAFVAQQFKDEGLVGVGTDGFYQPVKFKRVALDEEASSVTLVSGGKDMPLTLGKEVLMGPTEAPPGGVNAGAVFVGYGISAPEVGYDDFAGVDLHGKIAVYLAGGPETIKDPLRAHKESGGERWKAMKAAGAVGVITLFNTANAEIAWDRVAGNRRTAALELADPALRREQGRELALTFNPQYAEDLFAGSGHTMAEIIAAAKAKQPLPKFPLAVKLRATVKVNTTDVEAPNVAGELPGSDPTLKSQYVIVSAHLDHLGVGHPVNGDSIYNGAMDNASGVAALIQIAHDFRAAHATPKRSVIFLAVTGEEEGELGSWYFASRPTVPVSNIVADINMDMFLPLFPLDSLQVQGLDESTLGDDIKAVGQAGGVHVIQDEQPAANRFIRSDQYSFVQRGIPALAFKFGYTPGSPQDKIFDTWVHTRYHQPSDDLDQPVDKNAAGKFCHLLYLLANRVADEPARPTWEPTSFFRGFATR